MSRTYSFVVLPGYVDPDVVAIYRAKKVDPSDAISEGESELLGPKPRCALHKGIITGDRVICKHCGAVYCRQCAKELVDVETTCFACGHTLDFDWILSHVPER